MKYHCDCCKRTWDIVIPKGFGGWVACVCGGRAYPAKGLNIMLILAFVIPPLFVVAAGLAKLLLVAR
jgi:hypothetical protein